MGPIADLQAGVTVSVLFESPTGRQPAVVNVPLGGVNGNFYTIFSSRLPVAFVARLTFPRGVNSQ
jgi:hypothetical protein